MASKQVEIYDVSETAFNELCDAKSDRNSVGFGTWVSKRGYYQGDTYVVVSTSCRFGGKRYVIAIVQSGRSLDDLEFYSDCCELDGIAFDYEIWQVVPDADARVSFDLVSYDNGRKEISHVEATLDGEGVAWVYCLRVTLPDGETVFNVTYTGDRREAKSKLEDCYFEGCKLRHVIDYDDRERGEKLLIDCEDANGVEVGYPVRLRVYYVTLPADAA